jgi:hypothetical protein
MTDIDSDLIMDVPDAGSTDLAPDMAIAFSCPRELAGTLPRPIPAVQGLPDWFKALPARGYSDLMQIEQNTVKKCPPFIDAMTYGFLMPLMTDVTVEDGVLSWDNSVRGAALVHYNPAPFDFHTGNQVTGTPFAADDRFIVKFNNYWTIKTPPGYSLLITHPVNRADLPFTTLTGLVDCDRYSDNFVNFPALWHDDDFSGVLPKGTPIAQCIPVKRERWTATFGEITSESEARMREVIAAMQADDGVYRHRFRAPKR